MTQMSIPTPDAPSDASGPHLHQKRNWGENDTNVNSHSRRSIQQQTHPDPMWWFNRPFYKTTYHHMSKWSQSGLCLLVQMEIKCQIVAQKELKTRCRIKEWEMSHSQTTKITFPSYFIVHKIAVIIKSKVKQSFHGNDCLKKQDLLTICTDWPR